jgi:hypothetical protein
MAPSEMYLANPHDPAPDPARRWLRAGRLLACGRTPSYEKDDVHLWRAWRFRQSLENDFTVEDGDLVAPGPCPALAEAHRFFTTEPPLRRAELEARLLAGESDEDVAHKLGLSPAGVAAFHAVFFDVRSHLAAHVYIQGVVLGGKALGNLPADDPGLILKALGYDMGGPGVDGYLDFLRDPPVVPTSLDQMDLPALKKLRDKTAFKVALLATVTPVAEASAATWQRLRDRYASRQGGAIGVDGWAASMIPPLLDADACLSATAADAEAVAENPNHEADGRRFPPGDAIVPSTPHAAAA